MSIIHTGSRGLRPTPSARIGVVDSRIDVAEVNLAHEAINLRREVMSKRVNGKAICSRSSR